jgi:hypothetical protein
VAVAVLVLILGRSSSGVRAALTDAQFKLASWDWVQDTSTATRTWGALGDWDVSAVKDMSFAFSRDRNAAGSSAEHGNPKISSFDGAGLAKWNTGSVTTLLWTFAFGSINADLGNWDVSQISSLQDTFHKAATFEGNGLSKWNIAKVTDMSLTFYGATSLTSCNKRKIADAWESSSVFTATTYGTDWAGETCPKVREDVVCEERCGAICVEGCVCDVEGGGERADDFIGADAHGGV